MLDAELVSEIRILDLIFYKFRAQQRTQRWWKYVAILHRRLLRFVQANKVDPRSAEFIVNKLAPRAARAFHSVLTQGAFITLGFALLAALARIRTLLLPFVPEKTERAEPVVPTDEDLGEIVEQPPPKVEKKKVKSKRKSKHAAIDDIFSF